ncbi:polysaccharide pyruvyl transferase family protein [Desulfosarcina cetonica]|uniref:polysaccharide pyruvyl transferase family protein n=1 Tax=Desulfosarcina cetonica TaxID=90730 RepID=UPI001FEFE21D|nr:polysaccharide pyruvyl transferase family protein [Desulfosarcina cetonica]
MQKHLARMRLIAVRESVSEFYLGDTLGLKNVLRMVDPAFTLVPEKTDLRPFWPDKTDSGLLGLNISPLLERYRKGQDDLIYEIAHFIKFVVNTLDLSILLVPHVIESDGSTRNDDAAYMQAVLQQTGTMHGRVKMMDPRLNAAQIKYVVGHCRYFIGARTHSTIAALSSGVPTISIAYSIKAKGINKDLFGHLDYVLETPQLSAASLQDRMKLMIAGESSIKSHLERKMGTVHRQIETGVHRLKEMIHSTESAEN